MAQPIITLERLGKRFGETLAVDEVSLEIGEGEFFALLGPSGCGKTTLLRLIAGFEVPSGGRVLIDGQDMTATAPNRRPVNTVFQSYAVFPHMSVAENLAYGLRMDKVARAEQARRVEEALALVRLEGLGGRRPDQLSGGQRQRVALARALVKRPRVLLLDEPLSALDAKLREQMRFELLALQQSVGITFLLVTHDQSEALALAGRCAVMNQGRLEQVAAPAELYDRPASRFVADFIGQVNLIEGEVRDGMFASPALDAPVPCRADAVRTCWAALRPERIALVARVGGAPAPDPACVAATIRQAAYLGGEFLIEAELTAGRRLRVRRPASALILEAGAPVWLSWPAEALVVLTR